MVRRMATILDTMPSGKELLAWDTRSRLQRSTRRLPSAVQRRLDSCGVCGEPLQAVWNGLWVATECPEGHDWAPAEDRS